MWVPASCRYPLWERQLAGLIMWVPASTVHLLLLGLLCVQWLGDEERRGRPVFVAIARYRSISPDSAR